MPNDFLKKIAAEKLAALKDKEVYYANLKKNMAPKDNRRYEIFKKAISRPGQINLIAEIKKSSPSAGLIREDFDVLSIAKIYAEEKAAAISVLTEDKYFLGKPMYVKQVSEAVPVPVLTKDFIIDEGQIYEARYNGASAILLIVAILDDKELKRLLEVASALDLDCLVEVHDEQELKRALDNGAEIIGINNRDLHTFNVNIEVCKQLIPKIPKGKIIVAESGIKTHQDVKTLKDLGAHAVLIGETFMREKDIGKKIKEVIYGE